MTDLSASATGSSAARTPATGVAAGFPRVGIIGGGQLARMCQEAGSAMGLGVRVLARGPQESAARGGGDIIWGEHDDPAAVLSFAAGCDVVTFDHEHVPPQVLAQLVDRGVPVRPGPRTLIHAQDKIVMREALSRIGVACPAWRPVSAPEDVAAFADEYGWPVVLKVSRGGYDGRGVWVVPDLQAATRTLATEPPTAAAAWMVERFVPFTREIAAQVVRRPGGQTLAYPVVQTRQQNGICTEVIAPCPGIAPAHARAAQEAAVRIATDLDVVGILTVELFDTPSGVLVNELAMRPHNSGHWSIEGAVTSQFANHLRAVLDLPLGSVATRAPYTVMVNVLGGSHADTYRNYPGVLAADPELAIHMYGKDARPGRKLGHVTLCGRDPFDLLTRGRSAVRALIGIPGDSRD